MALSSKLKAALTLRDCVAMNTKYKHLNCEERTLIQLSLERGCTLRAIALSLDRNHSSVSRELSRNGWCNPKTVPTSGPGRPALAGGYRAAPAPELCQLVRFSCDLIEQVSLVDFP